MAAEVLGALAVAAAALLALYSVLAAHAQRALPLLRGKRVVVLIAHPDDEAMFFAPTVLGLTRAGLGNHVKVLCLSAGDAAGLGETRKRELVRSALALGVQSEEDVFVVDSPDFQDSWAAWDGARIGSLLCSAFAPAGLRPSIDVLVTFDAGGVSGHPNHVSLYEGARAFRAALRARAGAVDVYALGTVGVVRKYAGCADGLAALAWALLRRSGNGDGDGGGDAGARAPGRLVFANAVLGGGAAVGTGWAAMAGAHRSQMVWFRYLWLAFSRYMLVNELRLVE